jgi:hypothetical protein
MRVTFLLISISISLCTLAQQKKIDSLLYLLRNTTEDTTRALSLSYLSYYYLERKPDTAFILNNQALELSQKRGYLRGEAFSLNQLGNLYWFYGNYPKAISSYLASKEVSEKIGDSTLMAACLSNIGSIYFDQGDFRKALAYELNAKQLLENKPKNYASQGVDLDLGFYYSNLEMLDSASFYAQRSYGVSRNRNDTIAIGGALHLLGAINMKEKHYSVGLEYYRTALTNYQSSERYMRLNLFHDMAELFSKLEMYDSSLFYARYAYYLSKQVGHLKAIANSSRLLASEFEKTNQLDSAFIYQKIAATSNDSLFSQEKTRAIQNLELEELSKQAELKSQQRVAMEHRKLNLQYAAIAIALFTFVILYLALSRSIIVKDKFIRFFGILILLAVFEFINLFIHPFISGWTGENPVLMLAILISVAALLIPLHHKMEQWIKKVVVEKNRSIRLAQAKKTIAVLEGKSLS